MARDAKKGEEEEGGEFAEFMADISQEIAQRVESLDPSATPKAEHKQQAVLSQDAGVILEWENVADRIIEEMR